MTHKYVRAERIGFIIWPKTDELWHSHVGAIMRRVPIISAGFAEISENGVRCYGKSETLDMSSMLEDSSLLAAQLGLKGNQHGT